MENIKNLKEIKEMLHERNEYWWKEERPDLDLKYYIPTDVMCDSLAYYERGLTEEEYKAIYKENRQSTRTFFSYDEYDYFTNLEGAEYLGEDNTYNHSGNVQNDFQWHTIKLNDDTYIVLLAFHIGGDIRGNYTDYVVLEFDYEVGFEEFMGGEISWENGLTFDLDIFGKTFEITPMAFDECVEVYDREKDDYVYGVWGNDDESVRSLIIEKVMREYMNENDIIDRQEYNNFLEIESYRNIEETRLNYEKQKALLNKTDMYLMEDKKLSEQDRKIYKKYVEFLVIRIKKELEFAEKRSEKE